MIMKLVNHMLATGTCLATLEIVAMGRRMGLSLAAMTDVINKGSGRNRTSRVMLRDLLDGTVSESGFAMAPTLEDMNQAVQLGMQVGAPTPITNAVRGLLQIGVSQLGDDARLADMMGLIEGMARTRIVDGSRLESPTIADAAQAAKALRVGYVGLGTMGGALTRRLMLSRGMRVYDLRAEVVESFEEHGARGAADLPCLARDCDVIFVCVPTSADVRQAIFGEGGLAAGLAPGTIVVDQTTGDPTQTRAIAADLAKLGVPLVDAPVSGGPRGADAGTIAIICGGPADAYARVRPILESISPNLVYCGATGNGHVAKLIQNAVASCNRLLTYEAAAVGVKHGLTIADMAAAVNNGTGWSGATERILPALSQGKATADFQIQLMAKDLRLAAQMAIDGGAPMLVCNVVRSLFEAGVNELGGRANLDDMGRMFERWAGVRFAGA